MTSVAPKTARQPKTEETLNSDSRTTAVHTKTAHPTSSSSITVMREMASKRAMARTRLQPLPMVRVLRSTRLKRITAALAGVTVRVRTQERHTPGSPLMAINKTLRPVLTAPRVLAACHLTERLAAPSRPTRGRKPQLQKSQEMDTTKPSQLAIIFLVSYLMPNY